MKKFSKILSTVLVLCMVPCTFPAQAAVDHPTWALDQTFEEGKIGVFGSVTDETKANYGSDIIYINENYKNNNNYVNNNNYLGFEGADAAKQTKFINDVSVTGNESNVLQITLLKDMVPNGNSRICLNGTSEYVYPAQHMNESLIFEFDFRLPDLDILPNDGSTLSKHSLYAGLSFSGGGVRDLVQIRKNNIYIDGYNTIDFSRIGIGELDPAKWYKFTRVIDMQDCSQSIYIDGVLLASQVPSNSNIVAANTWNTTKLKAALFSFSSNTLTSDFRAWIDNVKIQAITREQAAQKEIDSIKAQVASEKSVYLPHIGTKVLTGSRQEDGNLSSTAYAYTKDIAGFVPNFSFSSDNTSIVGDDGTWYGVTTPKGNEPDIKAKITISCDTYRYVSDGSGGYTRTKTASKSGVATVERKRPVVASAISGLEIGIPVIDKSSGTDLIAESYVTSTGSNDVMLLVGFYDQDYKFLGSGVDKANVSSGTKMSATSEIPIGARYARILFWDSFLRPATTFDYMDLVEAGTPAVPVDIKLPADFCTLPFTLTRQSARRYTHTATPENQFGEGALNLYISTSGVSTNDGLSAESPIRYTHFASKCAKGEYDGYFASNGKRKFILNVVDEYYSDTSTTLKLNDLNADIMFRSASESGKTWFGNIVLQEDSSKVAETWSDTDGDGAYKCTLVSGTQVAYPINFVATDKYGMPKPYLKAYSIEECAATPGTFYQQVTPSTVQGTSSTFDTAVYVNPFAGESVADLDLVMYVPTSLCTSRLDSELGPHKLIYDNISFVSHSNKFQPYVKSEEAADSALMFFDCKFFRGNDNGLGIMSPPLRGTEKGYTYNVYVFDSIAAHSIYDGFNYQGGNGDNCLAVEINCLAYGSGDSHIGYYYDNKGAWDSANSIYKENTKTSDWSNNGSTAHFGMRMLRVGGEYIFSQGPVAADVSCYTINIGCIADSINPTAHATKYAGFYVYDDPGYVIKPDFTIECYTKGDNMQYGIWAGASDMYTLGCSQAEGIEPYGVGEGSTITELPGGWDAIISGEWLNATGE